MALTLADFRRRGRHRPQRDDNRTVGIYCLPARGPLRSTSGSLAGVVEHVGKHADWMALDQALCGLASRPIPAPKHNGLPASQGLSDRSVFSVSAPGLESRPMAWWTGHVDFA